MAIDWTDVGAGMLAAAKGVLGRKWPKVKDFAEVELKKLVDTLQMIERLFLSGTISQDEAELHLQIQKNAARTVLLTIQGLGILAAEEAVNAALGVLKAPVNTALGFKLL